MLFTVVLVICVGILFISALMVIVRIAKGPTTLDRMAGVDMITAIVVGAFALLAAATRRADLLPVFVALSIIGFLGSTTLARFAQPLTSVGRKNLEQVTADDASQSSRPETDVRKRRRKLSKESAAKESGTRKSGDQRG
ncbi:monovalent cation/H+ antiporter complex subunit F [Arcanobacterium ihumii]|uniref:monovalent cation/H+ antiporter complex subunit F n=1 Tax=Arcanobacterium ihumii TaxID=2138162 RepID=UPI000F543869|nr:monovalent cation/H+ antiporter complex subunit F [Arcanobacterium ihumii]